jgi:hypothetical protein
VRIPGNSECPLILHMKIKMIITAILVLLLVGFGCARLPALGDYVSITNTDGDIYRGNVTDVDLGFISITCLDEMQSSGRYTSHRAGSDSPPYDLCIGIGSIISLTWP